MALQRVTRSTIIDAPIERVWAVLRDFNSHLDWHPIIADSWIEGGEASDQVGCVRAFRLKDGNELREQLLEQSKKLSDEIRQKHEDLLAALERESQELRFDKTDRAALAAMFTELAMRLNNEFYIPGSEDLENA